METTSRATAAGLRLWSRRITGVLALTTMLMLSDPAQACHHFRYWAFKFPQRCGVARLQIPANSRKPVTVASRLATADEPDIPLPSLARTDFDGGEADEPTRARLLLRGILGVANAH